MIHWWMRPDHTHWDPSLITLEPHSRIILRRSQLVEYVLTLYWIIMFSVNI